VKTNIRNKATRHCDFFETSQELMTTHYIISGIQFFAPELNVMKCYTGPQNCRLLWIW